MNSRVEVPPLLDLHQLRFQRGRGGRAHFSLQLNASWPGPSVMGLFGPNGAGKSTLLELMAGRLAPQAGRVSVCGQDLARVRSDQRGRLVRHHPQPQAGTAARVAGPVREAWERVRDGVLDWGRDEVEASAPRVYLYDEPPLDPRYVGLLFDRFAALRAQGHLVIFCTHPTEAAHLRLIRGVCDRYAFIDDGHLRFLASFDAFMADLDVIDYLGALSAAL